MGTLKSTIVDPRILDNPLARHDIREDKKKATIEALDRALQEWEAFKKTSTYSLVCALADPKVTYFKGEVCKSVMDFPGWPVEVVKEHQAECRGALREWLVIRDQPGILKRELDQLNKQSAEEKEVTEGPSEATKKRLEKYT